MKNGTFSTFASVCPFKRASGPPELTSVLISSSPCARNAVLKSIRWQALQFFPEHPPSLMSFPEASYGGFNPGALAVCVVIRAIAKGSDTEKEDSRPGHSLYTNPCGPQKMLGIRERSLRPFCKPSFYPAQIFLSEKIQFLTGLKTSSRAKSPDTEKESSSEMAKVVGARTCLEAAGDNGSFVALATSQVQVQGVEEPGPKGNWIPAAVNGEPPLAGLHHYLHEFVGTDLPCCTASAILHTYLSHLHEVIPCNDPIDLRMQGYEKCFFEARLVCCT